MLFWIKNQFSVLFLQVVTSILRVHNIWILFLIIFACTLSVYSPTAECLTKYNLNCAIFNIFDSNELWKVFYLVSLK